jgi:ribosome-binding ATPase YchF (GTP1/OBG family)
LTIEIFLIRIQEYYSEYKPIVLHAVKQFLEIYRPETLNELFALCLVKYSNQTQNAVSFKPPPDVAMFNTLIDDAIIRANRKDAERKRREAQENKNQLPKSLQEEISATEADEYFEKIKDRLNMKNDETKEELKPINFEERKKLLEQQAKNTKAMA